MMFFLRRRVKRGACVALGCYTLFLLAMTWTGGEKNATELPPGHPRLPDKHYGRRQKGEERGGGGGRNQNGMKTVEENGVPDDSAAAVLLPETLDKVLQYQPGAPAARKKLSKPEVRELNVVVEDDPPDTVVRQASRANTNSGFEDLKPDATDKPSSDPGLSKLMDPRTLDRLLAGGRLDGFRTGNKEKSLRPSKDGVHTKTQDRNHKSGNVMAEREDSSFHDMEPKEEDESAETMAIQNEGGGVWIAPDGAVEAYKQIGDSRSSDRVQHLSDKQQERNDKTNRLPFKSKSFVPGTTRPDSLPSSRGVRTSWRKPMTSLNVSVSRQTANFVEISDVIIYSAFYDDRLRVPLVRIMGLGPISRRVSLHHLWCVFASASTEPVPVSVHQTGDCKRMKKYCFYMMHCQVPEAANKSHHTLSSLLIVTSEGKDKPLSTSSGERVRLNVIFNKNVTSRNSVISASGSTSIISQSSLFSVCVPPLFGKLTVLQIVEFIELNRLLGASYLTFYTFKVSRDVSRVLTFYEEAGMIRVMPWNLPAPNDIWNKGENVAMGDCLFRNMYIFDYVVFSHFDEYFMPRENMSWRDVMKTVDPKPNEAKIASYEVLPVKMYPGVVSKSEASTFLTLRNTLRENTPSTNFSKLVVKPERVLAVDPHFLSKPISELFVSHKMDPHTWSVYQFSPRTCSQVVVERDSKGQRCDQLVEDRTVWRYKAALVQRTKLVLYGLKRQVGSNLN